MNTVKIKRLNKLAKIPTRGTAESAGYDLYAATDKDIQISPHSNVKIGTGIAMSIPNGFFGGIFARSGVATKRNMRPSNCVGIIDSDYTGEVIVSIHNDSTETKTILAKLSFLFTMIQLKPKQFRVAKESPNLL